MPARQLDVDDGVGRYAVYQAGLAPMHERRSMYGSARIDCAPVAFVVPAAIADFLVELEWQRARRAERQSELVV
jgi:hypothetical protein